MKTSQAAELRRIGVLIPAFNEEARIVRVIAAVRVALPGAEIVVIDDGSTDHTASVASDTEATVVRLPFNLGYGAALQTGYRYAVEAEWDAAVQLDGDGQHEVTDAPALLQALDESDCDVVLGSRFLSDTPYPVSSVRRLAMAFFAWIASVATGRRITDPTSGFQTLHARALGFCCSDLYPSDFPDADVLIMLTRVGLRVREVPVRMYPAAGKPGMHAGIRAVYYMFKMTLSILVTTLRTAA